MKLRAAVHVAPLLMICVNLSACAAAYSARPITATIIDADTHEPVTGANVVAAWELEDPVAASIQGDLELLEAITGPRGEFQFPGWGPTAIPTSAYPGSRLTNNDPRIIIFKSGYVPQAVYNDTHSTQLRDPQEMGAPVRESQWDGKAIALKKFDGNPRSYASLIHGVLSGVAIGRCGWKKIPRMVIALNKESDRLMHEGVVSYPVARPSIRELVANEDKQCGAVVEYLNGFDK
jgi:hypothetical protein